MNKKQHKKMVKLGEMINEHFRDVSNLQNRVFKLITKLDRNIRTDAEYEALKKVIGLYRDNEKELNGMVEIYERRLQDYEDEHKASVNLQKGQ